eukprot:4618421-Alexandrium_andersonii.AAC.1
MQWGRSRWPWPRQASGDRGSRGPSRRHPFQGPLNDDVHQKDCPGHASCGGHEAVAPGMDVAGGNHQMHTP